jgi:hypothetical protein
VSEIAQLIAEIVERVGEVGQERVGPRGGEASADIDRLLGGGKRLLGAAEIA